MRPLWWMAGASIGSWAALAVTPGFASGREVFFGMLAPLLGAAATWLIVTKTDASRPELLPPLMVVAFGVKLVFFGVYVTMMLTVLSLRPLPFVISFTAYFIALHLFEALCLQRLFAGRVPARQ
jgi:hypothetical protein